MNLFALSIAFCCLLVLVFSAESQLSGDPILFVHGIMGSRLEERSPITPPEGNACKRKGPTDWASVWVDLNRILLHHNCAFESMFSEPTGDFSDYGAHLYTPKEGYETRPISGTAGTDVIGTGYNYTIKFFDGLEKTGYWKREENLKSFTYNWLHNPLAWGLEGGIFEELYNYIVSYFDETNKPITLLSHSNGAVLIANFLRWIREVKEEPEFVEKYFAQYLSIDPALGGSMMATNALFGETSAVPIIHTVPTFLHDFFSSFFINNPGLLFLYPRSAAVSEFSYPLVIDKATGVHYTNDMLEKFVWDLPLDDTSKVLLGRTNKLMEADTPSELYPGIPKMYVMYAYGSDTPSQLTIEKIPTTMDEVKHVSASITANEPGDGTMLMSTIRHYVKAFQIASGVKSNCPTKNCFVKEISIREAISHGNLIVDDDKHGYVSNWILEHVDH